MFKKSNFYFKSVVRHDCLYANHKRVTAFVTALITFCALVSAIVDAHEVTVHRAITKRAIDISSGYIYFLGNIFGYDASGVPNQANFGGKTANYWILEGSELEDEGVRSFNHFYDPIDKQGLTDFGISIPLFLNPLAFDSFTWATTDIAQGLIENDWNWHQARLYEYNALASSSKSDRDKYFGYMFRAVGQVMHLLEDTSQPEHVRNTQHLHDSWWHSYLEEYGIINNNYKKIFDYPYAYYHANVYPNPSTQDGLKSLWDRDVLSSGLSNSGASDSLLGLAEFTNKNFLGIRSLYGELESLGGIHHYAHPSLNETNISSVLEAFGQQGVEHNGDKDGVVRNGIYISKISHGLKVQRHSRLTYLGAAASEELSAKITEAALSISLTEGETTLGNYHAAFTIHDDLIEKEYLEVLLPTAVSYAAGCLDYFFRGHDVNAYFYIDQYTTALKVAIQSEETTLDGGKFEIYWDDANGMRSPMQNLVIGNHLDPQHPVVGTFSAPDGPIKPRQCIIVYKGNVSNGIRSVNDPVDSNIAIVACTAFLPASLQFVDKHRTLQVQFSGIQANNSDVRSGVNVASANNGVQTFYLQAYSDYFWTLDPDDTADKFCDLILHYKMADGPTYSYTLNPDHVNHPQWSTSKSGRDVGTLTLEVFDKGILDDNGGYGKNFIECSLGENSLDSFGYDETYTYDEFDEYTVTQDQPFPNIFCVDGSYLGFQDSPLSNGLQPIVGDDDQNGINDTGYLGIHGVATMLNGD